MTDKQKIKFQQEIIDKLEKENSDLKQQLESKSANETDKDSENMRNMMHELQTAVKEYKLLIAETTELNNEYKSHIQEIKNIKAKCEKDLTKFVKNLE